MKRKPDNKSNNNTKSSNSSSLSEEQKKKLKFEKGDVIKIEEEQLFDPEKDE